MERFGGQFAFVICFPFLLCMYYSHFVGFSFVWAWRGFWFGLWRSVIQMGRKDDFTRGQRGNAIRGAGPVGR